MAEYDQFDLQFHNDTSKRKRKKQIINDLKKQISFYFSDSNLAKDKFLRDLMLHNPDKYIALNTIESFNRISEMGCSRALLVKSISFLPELELSVDREMVRRATPINFDYSADDRTIYIENLPPKIEHKRLEQALSKYGHILHVSLPRFKNNKELKGFGFIEFKTVDDANKALQGLGWVEDDSIPIELKDVKEEENPAEMMNPPSSLCLSDTVADTPSTGTPDFGSDFTDFCSETDLFKDVKEELQKKKRRRRRSSICLAELKTPEVSAETRGRDPLLLVETTQNTALLTNSARKRKRTSIETVSPVGTNNKVRRVLNVSSTSFGSCSESDSKHETSDAELKKQLKIVKAKRRKKRRQKMKKKSELQDIRVFPKRRWNELKVMYKQLQKQQIAVIKKDLGMKSEGLVVRLCGVGDETDDVIRDLYKECVISILRETNQPSSLYIRFRTNPESHKTVALPAHLKLEHVSEGVRQHVNEQLASMASKRYLEKKRKRNVRGYTKVIKKCSAKDQTSQET